MDIRAWLAASRVYLEAPVISVLCLGFASGLPLLLTFSTLSFWLAEEGVSKTSIGLFALVGTPYALKFLWAPLIDKMPLPPLTGWLGRRRGWIVAMQILVAIAVIGLGSGDPATAPLAVAAWAVATAFASASQDVVIDAYRVEALREHQFGAGAAMIVTGYRVGMLAAGAGALFLAEALPWFFVYCAMAALMGIGIATVLLSPEPEPEPESAPIATSRPPARRALAWLREAVVAPFAEFMGRPGWLAVLAFVVLYKFGDSLAGVMANPFYYELGFSKSEIASVSKIFGLGVTLVGGFVGGLLVARHGITVSLMICGVLQLLSNLMFAAQALIGHSVSFLALTIGAENLAGGMGTAAFVAYLSALCRRAHTATQFALLSSLMATSRTTLSSGGGWLADRTDWWVFFVLTTVAAVPGLLLLWWLWRSGRLGYIGAGEAMEARA